jgi:hypothetical protein
MLVDLPAVVEVFLVLDLVLEAELWLLAKDDSIHNARSLTDTSVAAAGNTVIAVRLMLSIDAMTFIVFPSYLKEPFKNCKRWIEVGGGIDLVGIPKSAGLLCRTTCRLHNDPRMGDKYCHWENYACIEQHSQNIVVTA